MNETHYKNGEKDGVNTEWNKDGKKLRERNYKNGKRITLKAPPFDMKAK